jgi:hypothetical protein
MYPVLLFLFLKSNSKHIVLTTFFSKLLTVTIKFDMFSEYFTSRAEKVLKYLHSHVDFQLIPNVGDESYKNLLLQECGVTRTYCSKNVSTNLMWVVFTVNKKVVSICPSNEVIRGLGKGLMKRLL